MIYFKDLGNHGRLCNQFFQIAATLCHAIKNNDNAIFPNWEYNNFFNGIETDNIENFKISVNYQEPNFNYNNIPYIKDMNLTGYFQSEKYFYCCSDKIKYIFSLKDEYKNNLLDEWKDKLQNSISIHVRRGDYLSKQHYHPCPNIDYFKNSINYIKSKDIVENILIFSDDIEWCKSNFIDDNYIFVENQKNYEDLSLMSYCNHNIITNSSFSWWAGWLNNNTNKIICTPKKWFGDVGIDTSDLIPKDWIKI